MPELDRSFLAGLKEKLDDSGLEGMLAWGHPQGLETGKNMKAAEDLKQTIKLLKYFGNNLLHFRGGGLADRNTEPQQLQIERLSEMLKDIAGLAADYEIILAMENHMDFTADEQLEILARVDAPNLKVLLDTGNNLRILEDPIEVVKKLAPHAVAVHLKDMFATGKGNPVTEWRKFWHTAPLGKGIIDLPEVLRILKENNFDGPLNLEIDFLNPRWRDDDQAVMESIEYLRSINT
jgi:sugar phosphate isomerase/epimerase